MLAGRGEADRRCVRAHRLRLRMFGSHSGAIRGSAVKVEAVRACYYQTIGTQCVDYPNGSGPSEISAIARRDDIKVVALCK